MSTFSRLAHAAQSRAGADDAIGPPALDEPTNTPRLDAIIWLEEWLRRIRATLLVIYRTTRFPRRVVKAIVHIDGRAAALHRRLLELRRAACATVLLTEHLIEKTARERAHLQSFIDRFRAKGDQGAPGAEPHEDAGENGGPGAVHVAARSPSSSRPERSRSASHRKAW